MMKPYPPVRSNKPDKTRWRAVSFVLVISSMAVPIAQEPAGPSGPLEPVGMVVQALMTNRIVALGEIHGNEQGHAFRLSLLRDGRFTDLVNDIVVEFGNARYQGLVDRFVNGADAELRHVWQDTTQISGVWDRPIYEDFFRAVRDRNRSLPADRRIRVLLGDPPVDWDAVRRMNEGPGKEREGKIQINGIWVSKEDAQSLDRDAHAADVVRREVLDKGRRALLIFGEMHVRRIGNTVVSRIERSTGTKVFSVVNATATNYEALMKLFPEAPSWPVPRAVLTPRGAFSSGPFIASDAVLYLGLPGALTVSKLPASLCSDGTYLNMRRERMRWAGIPESKSEQMLARDCAR